MFDFKGDFYKDPFIALVGFWSARGILQIPFEVRDLLFAKARHLT
jgi:hypothetical protein